MSNPLETAPETPRYAQIADYYRRQIQSGQLRPGDRMPPFLEARARFGVAQSTLERAHQLLEQEELVVKEPGRGLFVAQERRRSRTGVIGMYGLAGSISHHAYYAQLLGGVHEAAERAGLEVSLLPKESLVQRNRFDGVLVYSWQADQAVRRLPEGLPTVVLLHPNQLVPSVLADERAGVRSAGDYLIAAGHRRIAYLGSWLDDGASRMRHAGYIEALRAAGIEPGQNWVRFMRYGLKEQPENVHDVWQGWGYGHMKSWLAEGWAEAGFTALLAHNDDSAIGAMEALSEAGISVPHDVSVIGFDDQPSGQFHRPRLSTVNPQLREIGALAVDMLRQQINAADEPGFSLRQTTYRPTLLDAQLVIRETTGLAPVLP